jgi:hypothetical protein
MIFGFDNVRYSSQSKVEFEELCEIEYLEGILKHLADIMGEEFKELDFVIYSANNTQGPNKPAHPEKTVLLYISDETMRVPHHLKPHFKAIFKCYIPVDRDENVFAMPLGYLKGRYAAQVPKMTDRNTNVFFSGNLNENRFPLYQHFNLFRFIPTWFFTRLYYRMKTKLKFNYSSYFPNSYINFTHGFNSGLSKEEYNRYLYDSKFIICPKGFTSAETFRHYEALLAGAVILSEPLPDVFYYRGGPFIQLKSWGEMDKVVNDLIKKPEELQTLQDSAREWWEQKCSEKAVAKYIYQSLKSL